MLDVCMKDYYLDGEERFGRFMSPLYDFVGRHLSRMMRFYDYVVSDLSKSDAKDILDVGTGSGTVPLMLYAKLKGSGRRIMITGIDPSVHMLNIARHKTPSDAASSLRFMLGSSRDVPGRRYDLIMSSISLHHWADKAGSLRNMKRHLKANGEIRIYELDGHKAKREYRFLFYAIRSHTLSIGEARRLAAEAGLRVKHLERHGGFLKVVYVPRKRT